MFSSPFLLLVFLLIFLLALCLKMHVINDFCGLTSSVIAEGQVKPWTRLTVGAPFLSPRSGQSGLNARQSCSLKYRPA